MKFDRKWIIAAIIAAVILIVAIVLVVVLRVTNKGESYKADIKSVQFTTVVTNPFFPLRPGARWTYDNRTDAGVEHIVVEVTSQTQQILGVNCVAVHNNSSMDGTTLEESTDYFAQDSKGNVWYFGEETIEYKNGKPTQPTGWKAGEKGAQPGIMMKAQPRVGDTYWQEYSPGDTEVKAKVLSLTEKVTVPTGSYENVLMIEENNPLESELVEHKYYASGIGLVLTVGIKGEASRSELVGHTP
jgi:hypothetical protein